MKSTRLLSLLALLPAVLSAGVLSTGVAAAAERPTADSTFVAAIRPDITRIRDEAETDHGPIHSWRAVRRLFVLRQERLVALSQVHGLGTLTGAATQDALDVEVLRAMHEISMASVQSDSVAPTTEDATRLAEVLANVPSLGEKPAGFMVMGFAGLAIAATDSLQKAEAVSPLSAARMGLRLVSHATTLHINAYADPLAALGQNDFLTAAFLSRLRCPQDGSAYSVNNVRTRLSGESLLRVYDLVCPVEGIAFQVEFLQEMASRLYQMAPLQKTQPNPEKHSSTGPDP